MTSRSTSEFQVGEVVDERYLLKREVSRGGMAIIFEAEQVHTGRRLALKTLLGEVGQDASMRQRLLHEGRALEQCRGPYVVDVIDAALDRGRPFLALEMLEGRVLGDLLTARTRLPLPVAVAVLRELCAALEVVHRAGLVHRDVKPDNLFVVREEPAREQLKLLDFGIAALAEGAPADRLTRTGQWLGTPDYTAPEQMSSSRVDHRADVFSATAVLFECLTGQVPYPGGVGEAPAPLLSRELPGAPAALDAVIARGLARDRHARFGSAAELAAAVTRAASVAPAPSVLDPPRPPTASQPRSYPRAPYVTPCRVTTSDQRSLDGRSADISEGGILALFAEAPPEGRLVSVRFCLPISGRVLTVSASPRWQRAARAQTAVGLEFERLPDDARDELRRFVGLMGAGGQS